MNQTNDECISKIIQKYLLVEKILNVSIYNNLTMNTYLENKIGESMDPKIAEKSFYIHDLINRSSFGWKLDFFIKMILRKEDKKIKEILKNINAIRNICAHKPIDYDLNTILDSEMYKAPLTEENKWYQKLFPPNGRREFNIQDLYKKFHEKLKEFKSYMEQECPDILNNGEYQVNKIILEKLIR